MGAAMMYRRFIINWRVGEAGFNRRVGLISRAGEAGSADIGRGS